MVKGILLVPQNPLDEQIEVVDNLYGKYDKVNLVDNDLTYCFQFPTLKREVYVEDI